MASTISISNELKNKIRNLGRAGDSYEKIIKKMYEISRGQILTEWLYDESNSISAKEALEEAKKKWSKSS